ncbi:MAG: Mur ligase family protein, partial [Chloroflexota bacterium]|nr:Mur ligase family protein [Chloroflexota bacterium]
MEFVETRVLDGPNLFLPRPAIKLEIANVEAGDLTNLADAVASLAPSEPAQGATPSQAEDISATAGRLLQRLVEALHEAAGAPAPDSVAVPLERQGHHAVAFSWDHRAFATALAKLARDLATGQAVETGARLNELRRALEPPFPDDDAPQMIRDAARSIPIIAVTGTNGKTTTTRLIASILRGTGRKVGWCSSVGVFIQGEQVLEGDYTGPSGAARVFAEPDLDVAVLETARGGILLRGLGYESNDVSVVTNISADHLGLHGIFTVEGLARVKRIVPRATRPGGFAVLNADDSRVLAMRDGLRARPFLITRQAAHDEVAAHVAAGGWALRVVDGNIHWMHDGDEETLISVEQIPITIGGRA